MPGFRSVLISLGLLGAAGAASASVCADRSAEILAALREGDYAAATTHFDARVKAAVDAQRLEQVWTQTLPLKFGTFDHADAGTESAQGETALVETSLHFAHGPLVMRVACDARGQVTGLRFAPAAAPPEAGPRAVNERRLDVPSPLGPLPGTLTLPSGQGPFPAVVMVDGSGPHDGDETIGPNKPFRDIAQGLAAAGIASLRYDKRTLVYGARIAARKDVTIDQEVTDDALAAVKLLATQPGVDPQRLFVLGHSLGGYMAPRIGQRDPRLAGLVLLAAPARPLQEVSAQQVREQGKLQGLTEAQVAQREQAIDAERQLLAKADPAHPPAGAFGGAPQGYWLSLRDYDAVAVAKGLAMPMLVLQGGSDFQVSPSGDFARWQAALAGRPQVAFHRYDGLNHLFMPAGKTGTPADYQVPGHVDAQVIGDMAAWIKAQPAHR